ncbi:hypothetical protein CONCODRAFT_100202 [Conidiobolus coronatus NRRL 28638]|uniref:Uncharacterized protein n=1 Tax=Conidiobolus coronatus (strain ATCC 28846 / CBS 209.66 / NRRL 28638) TaxID=796925 RepID=A0A137P1Z5_CONC2|nr:hypothetical protein CONCODRAFT_100202 [Conidiobolus coronatus NRRL 28638]|eukprot:KXN69032.1 hypothetical protein CONCODRAFT_100202 [Conidiobolus coronatus NRRL 28638]
MLPFIYFCLFPFFCSGIFLNYIKLLREIEEDINKPCTIQGHSYLSILDRFELNHRLREMGKGNGCYYRSYIQLASGDRVFYPEFLPLTIDKIKYTVNAPRTYKHTHELLKQLPSHYEPSIISKILFSKPSASREPEKTTTSKHCSIPKFDSIPKTPPKTKFNYFQCSKDYIIPAIFIILGLFFELRESRIRYYMSNYGYLRLKMPDTSSIKHKLCFCIGKLRRFFVNVKLSLLSRFKRQPLKKHKFSKPLQNLKPLTFTGKFSEVRVFLKQLDLIFKVDRENFDNDSKKVIFAMFHLSPDVFEFVNDYIEQTVHLKNCRYKEFAHVLKTFYSANVKPECLREQLDLIYLSQYQDVVHYCRQIISLCLKFSLSQPDICKIMIEMLSNELGGDLDDGIRSTTDLGEFISKVAELSKNLPCFHSDFSSECSCQLNQHEEYTPSNERISTSTAFFT